MFADLVYQVGSGRMQLRVFMQRSDRLCDFPMSRCLHAVTLSASEVVELAIVQGIKAEEVDSEGRLELPETEPTTTEAIDEHDKPVFRVRMRSGHAYLIWENGRIAGFPKDEVEGVFNAIPLIRLAERKKKQKAEQLDDDTAPPLTVNEVLSLLTQVVKDGGNALLCTPAGPVRRIQVELGANEPYVVLS